MCVRKPIIIDVQIYETGSVEIVAAATISTAYDGHVKKVGVQYANTYGEIGTQMIVFNS